MNPGRIFRQVALPLLLALSLAPAGAQSLDSMSSDELIARLTANRPVGPRTLVPPPLLEALPEKSWEQGTLNTDSGLAAWRDIFAAEGADEFGLRHFFVPLKAWKLKKPKQMLDDARKQMVDGVNTILVEEKDYVLDGCPRRTFVIRIAQSGKMLRLDYILVYPDLFILSYTGTEAGLKSTRVEQFFATVKTTTPDGQP